MVRRVFYSFDHQHDTWRVQQVMNMGAVEGQPLLGSHAWEDVAAGGDSAIKAWIDEQMKGTSCNVVLIGSNTANRRWINYEIRKAWDEGLGVVGVHINRLRGQDGYTSLQGQNPFAVIRLKNGSTLDRYVRAINPAGLTSKDVSITIRNNIEAWVEQAISDRSRPHLLLDG